MLIDRPAHFGSQLVIVADANTNVDRQLREHEGRGPYVLRDSKMGGEVLPKRWLEATRIALFEHGSTPDSAERAQARKDLVDWLEAHRPPCVVVLPTPSASMDDNDAPGLGRGTMVWDALQPPDSIDSMRGCFWQWRPETLVVPVYPLVPVIKEMQKIVMGRWLNAAHFIAEDKASVRRPAQVHIQDGDLMHNAMRQMRGRTLAVDIETIPNQDVITAIGLAAGDVAVSVPWDPYQPSGEREPQPGLPDGETKELVRVLLAAPTAKVLQNGVYDLPQLRARGLAVNGEEHDTLALHAIAYPELRHSLQLACATELVTPPWKSIFKAGAWKKDDPEFWYYRPEPLRNYNALDAYYTLILFQTLAPRMGVPCAP